MIRHILQRIFWIPVVLILVNFVGFAFAHATYQLQLSQTSYGSGQEGFSPVWPEYSAYIQNVLRGDFGSMPIGADETVISAVAKAAPISLGLLALAFILSLVFGLVLGLSAVEANPPRSRTWLTFLSTVGLAMPSFYIGIVMVGVLVMIRLRTDITPPLPVAGYGWDLHLVLPALALVIRPTMQTAQVAASLLSGELGKRYVVAARSFGHTWRAIRWDKAMRNVLAPIFLMIAGSFRMLVVELVLVEWLFSWPGIGRLLVFTLVPPRVSTIGGMIDTSVFYLNPPLVALLLSMFALLFLLADLLASTLARMVDPRMSIVEEEAAND